MRKPFQVGDRVRAFGITGQDSWHAQIDGTVVEVREHPSRVCFKSDVEYEGCVEHFVAVPEQCRRLRPKRARREWWLNLYQDDIGAAHDSKEAAEKNACTLRTECVHVREARPGKERKE